MPLTTYWKKGMSLLVLLFGINLLINKFASAYLVPISLENFSVTFFTSFAFLITIAIVPLLVGFIDEKWIQRFR